MKINKFDYKAVKKYVDYVGDSYLHVSRPTPKSVLKIMDHFFEINKMIEEANERYEKKNI